MENLIKKYTDRLKNLKQNLSNEFDKLSDKDIEAYNKEIEYVAEFISDLKKVKSV
jgi:iron uptake system EfeUOB component EfeO/EfeM